MNLDRLKALVEHAVNTKSAASEFSEDGLYLTIKAIPMPAPRPTPLTESALILDTTRAGPGTIHSSLFGLFHLQEGGADTPFVSLGQTIEAGQKIGLIEAMKVFSPVIAHRAGRIVAVLAEHGAEVKCGQPLFHVE